MQQEVANLKAWRGVAEPALVEIHSDTKELLQRFARIEAYINANPPCSSPGSCGTLEPRVRALEDVKNNGMGMAKAVTTLGTIIVGTATLTAAAVETIHYFIHSH